VKKTQAPCGVKAVSGGGDFNRPASELKSYNFRPISQKNTVLLWCFFASLSPVASAPR
jgi:hypothetical protein